VERLIIKELVEWKAKPNRKPLIIRGARQVGKSYIVRSFGEKYFKGRIHIVDFERDPSFVKVFEQDLNPKRILAEFEFLLNTSIDLSNELLFLDEIQSAPRAIMALRYFYEELKDIHIIAAGSLLEFALTSINFPVGRVQLIEMYPMNFREYLMACNKSKLVDLIRDTPRVLPDVIHKQLLDHLAEYFILGGMPESIAVWLKSLSYQQAIQVQSDLVDTFRQDFSKYKPSVDRNVLLSVLNYLGKNIGKQIKYVKLSELATGPTNKKALELLQLARLISLVRAASPASLPLMSASSTRLKAIMLDIGFMNAVNGFREDLASLRNGLMRAYQGRLVEQFIGQELNMLLSENLTYYSREARGSSAEVDYLIERGGEICPIEVKSGKSGKLKSLHLLISHYPHIEKGFVLSTAPYGSITNQKLVFLPLYYIEGLINAGWDI
jgi:hypothetical protein